VRPANAEKSTARVPPAVGTRYEQRLRSALSNFSRGASHGRLSIRQAGRVMPAIDRPCERRDVTRFEFARPAGIAAHTGIMR
jgi:hypothetical protein